MTLADRIVELLAQRPGISDRELTDVLFDRSKHPSAVNQTCRRLASVGTVERIPDGGGTIGNFVAKPGTIWPLKGDIPRVTLTSEHGLSEDSVKAYLESWLSSRGWSVKVAWGKAPGIDIAATKFAETWLIEAKGCGSLQPMRLNYFLAALGETLQRMSNSEAKYSIALPDLAQFRGLWGRLPTLAKQRTGISALFVSNNGDVEEAP